MNLLLQIDAGRPRGPVDDAFIKTPDVQDFKKVFAQIGFEHQKLKKNYDLETSLYENVKRIPDTPLPGVEFWKAKTRIN